MDKGTAVEPDGNGRAAWLRGWQIALLTTGTLALPLIFFTWLQAQFSIWGTRPDPTSAQISAYEWTAGISFLIAVASLVLAIIRHRRASIALSVIVLLLISGSAYVFSVPQARWVPTPAPAPPAHAPYQPCFSGSNDCVGG